MIRIKDSIDIETLPGVVALQLRNPSALAEFPGVTHAFVGHPGLRVDLAIAPMGLRLRDRLLLSWKKPSGRDYPFGIEGGRWVHGTGTVHITPTGLASEVCIEWELELPLVLAMIPGMRFAVRRLLKASTSVWLVRMKKRVEGPSRPLGCGALSLAEVGA